MPVLLRQAREGICSRKFQKISVGTIDIPIDRSIQL